MMPPPVAVVAVIFEMVVVVTVGRVSDEAVVENVTSLP
jgi:hypothetical protein